MKNITHQNQSLQIGVIVNLSQQVESVFDEVVALGLSVCQLSCWQPDILDDQLAQTVEQASRNTGVVVSSFWAGHSGTTVWDFLQGPATIGLAPPDNRDQRVEELKRGANFAAAIGAPSITTHVGFIPENPNDPQYPGLVEAIRDVAAHAAALELDFCFETGQETPTTLLRTIEDVGGSNLAINLDPANLILYGKANPVDALDVFGRYVKGFHAKDGLYPTTGTQLGRETPLGQGRVDFPTLVARLRDEFGYTHPLIIEREISGEQQKVDIRRAIEFLTPLCSPRIQRQADGPIACALSGKSGVPVE